MFKAGDAILYEDADGWVIECLVKQDQLEHHREIVVSDWRYIEAPQHREDIKNTWADKQEGHAEVDRFRPHPNPDEFLARYTAHRLVNG